MIEIPIDDPLDWRERWIVYDGRDEEGTKHYIAYAEDYSELGMFETWDEAAIAINEYAKTLEIKNPNTC